MSVPGFVRGNEARTMGSEPVWPRDGSTVKGLQPPRLLPVTLSGCGRERGGQSRAMRPALPGGRTAGDENRAARQIAQ